MGPADLTDPSGFSGYRSFAEQQYIQQKYQDFLRAKRGGVVYPGAITNVDGYDEWGLPVE